MRGFFSVPNCVLSGRPERTRTKKNVTITVVGIFVCTSLFVGVSYAFARSYDGRIAPHVWIGPLNVSGMDQDRARQELNHRVDVFLLNGVEVLLAGKTVTIPLTSIGTGDTDAATDVVVFGLDTAIQQALHTYRTGPAWIQPFALLFSLFRNEHIKVQSTLHDQALRRAVTKAFPDVEHQAKNAAFTFTKTNEVWRGDVTPSRIGEEIPFDIFLGKLAGQLEELSAQPITLELVTTTPSVRESDVEPLLLEAESALHTAPYTLTHEPDRYTHRQWPVTAEDLTIALAPIREKNDVVLGLSEEGLTPVLDRVAAEVERKASDATFHIQDGRVVEFSASTQGVTLDRTATTKTLVSLFPTTETTATIVVHHIEPTVATEDVNDLGIQEMLGMGISNFSGSPPNRVKNIQNGARLLNGILIQPDETFSLLQALRPFDVTNGYLPELVINGDRIEPQIGGGLCQIGTTTFRATMNAGLPVLERQNHSLVVRYYNDPSNGNPGTDATIYDPAPDFQFRNDTGHPILFQTEVDEEQTELRFTLWGTSDGRKGSYTAPELVRWIDIPDPVRVETADLEPGVEQCQHAFPGADARFTYTIEQNDGSVAETVFESHYRALPQICLVGKTPEVEEVSLPSPALYPQ
jgi:vancomycin resistance protein YoaR